MVSVTKIPEAGPPAVDHLVSKEIARLAISQFGNVKLFHLLCSSVLMFLLNEIDILLLRRAWSERPVVACNFNIPLTPRGGRDKPIYKIAV